VFAALYAPSIPAAALIAVARAFTPRFEQIPPHDAKSASRGPRFGSVVLLDASGLSRLFGTAQELGEHLRDALEKQSSGDAALGNTARIAITSTQTAATLLALGSPGLTVVMPGKEAIALAPLRVNVLDAFEKLSVAPSRSAEALKNRESEGGPQVPVTAAWHHPRSTHQASRGKKRAPENRLLEIFNKWGIRTLGALTALSGPEIHERFGERGAYWQSLARGIDARPMVPWVDEVPFEAALELEWPIEGLEPLSFVLARLLEPLSERLERADRGAAVIYTSLRLTSRTVFTRTLQLPAPMRDPKTLRTLVLLDLESHPPDAPIDIVRVFIEPTPAKVLQWTLLERAQPAVEQVTTLTARLTALMGAGHVGSPRLVDTWKAGSFTMSDFGSRVADQLPKVDRTIENQSVDPQSTIDPQSEICNLKSALRRFRFPIPARVVVTEGRPVRVQVDRPGFNSGAILQAAGPWRTSGNWWDTPGPRTASAFAREQSGELRRDHHAVAAFGREGGWDRDEWDVAMHDGTVYRLVVERGVGQWFLEGIID
jgi:protein ImuB